MNREPQFNSDLKERIIKWLKKTWASFRAWFKHYWQLFVAMLKKFWHRYQLTRWIIVIFLGIFLITSIHLLQKLQMSKILRTGCSDPR